LGALPFTCNDPSMPIECRQRRSDHPQLALVYFLQAEARRRGARALTLGTTDGLLVAGCGDGDLELLAAAGSLHAGGQEAMGRREVGRLDSVLLCGKHGPLVMSYAGASAPPAEVVDRHIDRILAIGG
jgi:predicted regulator of Ras-like GTPase activity (Roadblock/LC7/MglB family)